jgi:hypothetical protein
MTLAYRGGERKISIPDGTKIVALATATRSDLKPGAVVSAQGVSDGDDGAIPPM